MKKDRLKIYILELLLVAILFFTLFASNINLRWFLAIILLVFMFVVYFLIKKRGIKSVYDKQVLILMLIFALIYLGIFYLLGVTYYGFEKTKYIFTIKSIYRYIIPTTIIIICSEIIRFILISQDGSFKIKGKQVSFSGVLIYLSMILIDYIIYANIYNLNNLDDFLSAIGFVLFATMSNNLLFNYLSKRFGPKSIILFRLVTVLYIYIFPVIPSVYLFLRTFLRMLYPFIIYLVIERTYAKSSFVVSFKDKKKNIFSTFSLLVFVTLLIMLISCQFKYGIIVIGSDSMTGTINRGDAIIFKRYDHKEKIKKDEIVLFDFNGLKTIHRVVEIKNVNGRDRYYTKGDANKNMDNKYRFIDEIDGVYLFKIKYIGKPTLWLRSLFKK